MKQVIVIRKDLKMRRGKEIAQGAHASLKATLENLDHSDVKEWLAGKFTKIVVTVKTEEELKEIYQNALNANLVCSLILDAGLTEFDGTPTYTAVAVGPAKDDRVNQITGHLKLY